jgi:hypothetical protein
MRFAINLSHPNDYKYLKSLVFTGWLSNEKESNGAGNRIRTGDLLHGKQTLYQLSYTRVMHITKCLIVMLW